MLVPSCMSTRDVPRIYQNWMHPLQFKTSLCTGISPRRLSNPCVCLRASIAVMLHTIRSASPYYQRLLSIFLCAHADLPYYENPICWDTTGACTNTEKFDRTLKGRAIDLFFPLASFLLSCSIIAWAFIAN